MSQSELLMDVAQFLDASGIPYMVTGSHASSYQGQARSTHDVDLVVHLRFGDTDGITQKFSMPDFYVERQAIIDAIRSETMFNIIDNRSADRVDFWMLHDTAFDQSRFSRRLLKQINGAPIYVSTPEDTILMKLKWARDCGGSEKQMTDVVNVYDVQREVLDHAYLLEWSQKIGVDDLLEEAKKRAGGPPP